MRIGLTTFYVWMTVFLALILLPCSGCFRSGEPRLFTESNSRELGTIRPGGEPTIVSFEIKNSGDSSAAIQSVHISCNCADAKLDRTDVQPDGNAILNVTLDTDKPGERDAVVVVKTSSSQTPTLSFHISWTVSHGVVPEKRLVIAKDLRLNVRHEELVKLTLDGDLGSVRVRCNPPDVLDAELRLNNAELAIGVTASQSTNNELRHGAVTIERTSGEELLTIPVKWITKDEISVNPRELLVGGKGIVKKQLLVRTANELLGKTSVSATDVDVLVSKIQEGSGYLVFEIAIPVEQLGSGERFLFVKVDDIVQLKVPILVQQ